MCPRQGAECDCALGWVGAGGRGWLWAAALALALANVSTTPVVAQEVGETAYVSASALNVRAGPGVDEPLVGRLARGARVRIADIDGDWARVETGWVARRYLSENEPPQPVLSNAQIRRILVEQSLASYPGSCPCPYNYDRGGRRCGGRSAYSRPGGYAPRCYASDVSLADVERFRRQIERR